MGKHLLHRDERDRYGAIVCAIVDGRARTRVGYGKTVPALEDAVAALEALGPIESVLSISTPGTIHRDLLGPPRAENPEAQLLARIARTDLAPPARRTQTTQRRKVRLLREEKGRQ